MPMARGCLFQTRTHPCSYSAYLPARRMVEGAERGASISVLRCYGRRAAACGCVEMVEMVDMVICLPLPTFHCRCVALRTRSVPELPSPIYLHVVWCCMVVVVFTARTHCFCLGRGRITSILGRRLPLRHGR